MFAIQKPASSQLDIHLAKGAFEHLLRAARRLLWDLTSEAYTSRHISVVKELLASVPLTTEEYVVAHRRLQNAMEYVTRGEIGAARYEVSVIVRRLSARLRAIE
jgi:hypothetical protein